MRKFCARSIVLLSITLFASTAGAQEASPQEFLSRMTAALRSLDFQGSFIYQHDGRVDALRIFHLGGERERERLVSLTGDRGEIVRDNDTITCVQPGSVPTLFANRADPRLLPLVPNVHSLGAEYGVEMGGEDRVAGYSARVIDISPRDAYRYGYRLWLDRDSHLLLRSAVMNSAHRPLEQFMFVALAVGERPTDADLLPTMSIATAAAPADEVRVNSKPAWTIAQAPPGFHLVRTQRPPDASAQTEHLVYSDGVASVSIYVEPRADAAAATTESTSVRGVLSLYSRSDGRMRVTAVGDVPPITVQTMGRSVEANNGR
ncbi:MAG: MucB/RseB C-terminal domain-containing protein [Rhodanobacteraceae bacterium]